MVENSAAPSTAIIHQASIEAEASLGERIVRALEEAAEPAPVAVGLFERGPGRCEIFAHYDVLPEREALLALIAQAGGNGNLSLTIEEIEPADWVTLSQAQRGPGLTPPTTGPSSITTSRSVTGPRVSRLRIGRPTRVGRCQYEQARAHAVHARRARVDQRRSKYMREPDASDATVATRASARPLSRNAGTSAS